MITIKKIDYCVLNKLPGFDSVREEYMLETAIKEMLPIEENLDLYGKLNEHGSMITLGVFDDDFVVGYANLLLSPNLHYSKTTASTESFFVKSNYRNTGAGKKLLKEMELIAKENGAVAFMVSAPTNSKLSVVMNKSKSYQEVYKSFFKSLI
jgi:GNAT superfamily N-acetyltransferase